MKRYTIIVAGGKGERMGNDLPKQFIPINGLPILMHTIQAFYDFDPSIRFIVVLPVSQISRWNELCLQHKFSLQHKIAEGGATRFDSVKNGLALIQSEGVIAVHDGVRPLVSNHTLQNCFSMAEAMGSAIPVEPIVESLRKITTDGSISVDRSLYRSVQTPQIFQSEILRKAYNQCYQNKFTDDASVVEALGMKVNLVEGNRENIKITTPPDLKIAAILLSEKTNH